MKKTNFTSFAMCIFFISSIVFGQDEVKKMSNDALAKKLVNQCAKVQENDIVWVNGGVRDMELLENIVIEVRKLGAFPLLTISSDRMTRKYYDEVSSEYDSQLPQLDRKLAEMINASIFISYNENAELLADVSPERRAAVNKAYIPVNKIYLQRNPRLVSLGNGLYPTKDLSKRFGIPIEQLSRLFWDGIGVDYQQLEKTGMLYQTELAQGKILEIIHPNGTDFRVNIEGRPVMTSTGMISKADVEQSERACQVWLPAGEVYLTPVAGTAEGKIIVDRQFYQGKEIKNLELIFKAGKLISMDSDSDISDIKARYEAAGEGKDEFAFIDIGLNPNVKIIPKSRMVAWMASGMVTVGIGSNLWAGGENETNYFLSNFIPGSTLKVDGKILVKEGRLNL
jgi:leucyl aminopeptidase (aminopeptidase T)